MCTMLAIALAGSRSITSHHAIAPVVQAALASGASLSVGCCVGADALCIHAALAIPSGPQALHIYGIGCCVGASARGWCSLSAVGEVRAALAAGAHVLPWCGGSARIPLAARLVRRSQAVVASAQALMLFSPGFGSLATAAFAAARSMPVFVFGAPPAPVCAGGKWAQSSLFGRPCWAWQPTQARLI